MWTVILVAEQELEGVLAVGLGLHGAEVQMIEVVRNRLAERRQFGVDQQMVMARVLAVRPSGRNAHVAPYAAMPKIDNTCCRTVMCELHWPVVRKPHSV
jgi:hypothetical protein